MRSKILHLLLSAILGASLAGGAMYAYAPTPPAPAPAPAPAPTPPPPTPDAPPKAVVSGLFLSVQPLPQGVRTPMGPLGMFRLDASASTTTRPIRWKVVGPPISLTTFDPKDKPGGSIAEAIVIQPGTYRFAPVAIGTTDGEPDADIAIYEYTVAEPGPPPPPPDPDPKPPPPPPTPDPVKPPPIPGPDKHVLIIFSNADWPNVDPDIRNAILSQGFRDMLTKTVGVGNWQVFAAEGDFSQAPQLWQDAMKRPHPEMPWIIVSDGKSAAGSYEGKFPGNVTYATDLVQKLLGGK